jgi:hypothetical protein
MSLKLKAFLLVLVWLPISCFAGQTWLTWTTRSGLPGNNILCLAVTKGKMAVGTDKGIGLFLDSRMVWLKLGDYCQQLKGLAARSLEFDNNHNLWVATSKGLGRIYLEKFPEEAPLVDFFGKEHGLSTIDTEIIQIINDKIYVGCFGGWIFEAPIGGGGASPIFRPVNVRGGTQDDTHRIVSVGITGIAMDFPGGGIYSTKGKGLLEGYTGDDYLNGNDLPSDWVNDFWSFEDGNSSNIIALCQKNFTLLRNREHVADMTLPAGDSWISCVVTYPDEETNPIDTVNRIEDNVLNQFLGKRILYLGTKDRGLWKFDEGRWENLTANVSPLPSNCINKLYFIPGAKKMAVCTDSGLVMFSTEEDYAYDEFEFRGSTPYFAKTYWPFMQLWGPRVYGYPWERRYPIDPYIAYHKIIRGKDLWVSHDMGLSRYVMPTGAFLGAMANRYYLSGNFDNPVNYPAKNLLIEDNSIVNERPNAIIGERIWHHYCKEQPNDISKAPMASIYTSLDMKTICGPENMIATRINTREEISLALAQEGIESAAETLEYPPVPVFYICRGGEKIYYDQRKRRLYTVAEQNFQCPLHYIPSTAISDYDLDLNDRCWIVFDGNMLSVLDGSSQWLGGLVYETDFSGEWYDFKTDQLPWGKHENILCVKRVGADIYFGTENSGVFILPLAHTKIPEEITWQDWQNIRIENSEEQLNENFDVKAIEFWETEEGRVVALMHKKGLSIIQGNQIIKIPVPKRNYTCIESDRTGRLWLGAIEGLLYITPDLRIETSVSHDNTLDSDRITSIAAAPDDAKYPWLIAVACDEKAGSGFSSSDVPPMLQHAQDNPYKLVVKNPSIQGSSIGLFDGENWERLSRPGVHHLMFDQKFLWATTSSRIMRLYMPVEVTSY